MNVSCIYTEMHSCVHLGGKVRLDSLGIGFQSVNWHLHPWLDHEWICILQYTLLRASPRQQHTGLLIFLWGDPRTNKMYLLASLYLNAKDLQAGLDLHNIYLLEFFIERVDLINRGIIGQFFVNRYKNMFLCLTRM